MKVMHLLTSGVVSGAEMVVLQLMDIFKDCECLYCSLYSENNSTVLAARGVPHRLLKSCSVKEIKAAIREFAPDVIHAHDVKASVLAAASAPKRVRIVSHIHCAHKDMVRPTVRAWIFRLAAKRFNSVVWVSCDSLEQYCFKRYVKGKSTVLPNVLNCEAVLAAGRAQLLSDPCDLVYVGRYVEEKDPLRLMRLLDGVVKARPQTSVKLIGKIEEDNPLFIACSEYVSEHGMGANVEFLNYVSNPYPLIKSAKAMVLSSRSEGLPMCVIESQILGTPVISTAVGGVPEVISDGETGFLFVDDDEGVKKILRVLDDGNVREYVSRRAAKESLQRNDISKYRQKMLSVYTGEGSSGVD